MKMTGRDNTTTMHDVDNMFRKMENYFHPKPSKLYSVYFESPYINESISFDYIEEEVRTDAKDEYLSHYSISNSVLLADSRVFHIEDPSCTTCMSTFHVRLTIDRTENIKNEAAFSMLATTLVIFVIFFGTKVVTDICDDIIITPMTDELILLLDKEQAVESQFIVGKRLSLSSSDNDGGGSEKKEIISEDPGEGTLVIGGVSPVSEGDDRMV